MSSWPSHADCHLAHGFIYVTIFDMVLFFDTILFFDLISVNPLLVADGVKK